MLAYKAEQRLGTWVNDEAARVHRAYGRECHIAVSCAGAGTATGAELSPTFNQNFLKVFPRIFGTFTLAVRRHTARILMIDESDAIAFATRFAPVHRHRQSILHAL